jgi:superfamily II helicase
MSITHNLDYCISSVDQKKIETFFIGNNNINITHKKTKMEFVILDTPVEIVNDYGYVIKAWLYDSQQRYGEYSRSDFFETEDDARIEYNNFIQTKKFSKVMLIRIDPDANEDRETIINEWGLVLSTCDRCSKKYLARDMQYVRSYETYFCKECWPKETADPDSACYCPTLPKKRTSKKQLMKIMNMR